MSNKILDNKPVFTSKLCWNNNEILSRVIDNKINKNFINGLFIINPKKIKTLKYDKKITKKNDVLPSSVNKILEKKAPQKPKKFVISEFPTNLPIPGSLGL